MSDRSIEYATKELQLMILKIRSKLRITEMKETARILRISTTTMFRISRAPDPSVVKINRGTRLKIEKCFAQYCENDEYDLVKIPEHVRFDFMLEKVAAKGIAMSEVAKTIGVHENTLYNYKKGRAMPSYANGVKTIKYSAKILTVDELRKSGVPCD